MEYRFRFEQGTLYAFAKGELDMNMADAWRTAIDQELNETYVIFITENDVLGENLPIYHVDRIIRETGKMCERYVL